jgi:DNA-binding FadR family transcriptional regulator
MPIQTVDTDRLYRKIARQISELIAAGEFAPGQRLPAERDLAHQLGVSRPSVREALIALEIEGKVEVRVGSGVYVIHSNLASIPSFQEEGEGPFETLLARRVVEGETAAWAAKEATPAELAEIRAAVAELQQRCDANQGCDPADRNFHLGIAQAAHNGAMASLVLLLFERGRGAMWRQMEKHFETPAVRTATLREHRAILKGIQDRDPRDARTAMHRHLDRVARDFERGWEALKRKTAKKPRMAARRALP